MSFNTLGLPDFLLHAVKAEGYTTPTPIQTEAIPLILSGKDLIAQAQTGTGKTAAFALPLLKMISEAPSKKKKSSVLAVVLAPTRELVLQVARSFRVYGQFAKEPIKILPIIGGEDINVQTKGLRRGIDIVVATPGRLLELIEMREIRLNEMEYFILDEADKMLALGFADELSEITKRLPKNRQSLLFSATFTRKVTAMAEEMLNDPAIIKFEEEKPTVEDITQRLVKVDENHRGMLLRHLINSEGWEHTLVFVASKRAAYNLTSKLNKNGISAIDFHGDLTQDERVEALRQFKNKKYQVMVATDIAARGIDINKLSHVVNFDLPRSAADYVHRIGRTGRAGEKGMSVTFVSANTLGHYAMVERVAKIKLEGEIFPGFPYEEPKGSTPKGTPPVKGKRPSKKDKLRAAAKLEAEKVVDENTAE